MAAFRHPKKTEAKLLERWSGEKPGSHGAAAAQQHSLGLCMHPPFTLLFILVVEQQEVADNRNGKAIIGRICLSYFALVVII
jgi:hypothetical protein